MSETITIHLDNETELRMKHIAKETGRDVRTLCGDTVSEAALSYFRNREDDPAKQ